MLEYWSPETVNLHGATIPLQQAMIHNQLPYWHSPAAMWLVLEPMPYAAVLSPPSCAVVHPGSPLEGREGH